MWLTQYNKKMQWMLKLQCEIPLSNSVKMIENLLLTVLQVCVTLIGYCKIWSETEALGNTPVNP